MVFGEEAKKWEEEQAEREAERAAQEAAQRVLASRDAEVLLDLLSANEEVLGALLDLLLLTSEDKLQDLTLRRHYMLTRMADGFTKKFYRALKESLRD